MLSALFFGICGLNTYNNYKININRQQFLNSAHILNTSENSGETDSSELNDSYHTNNDGVRYTNVTLNSDTPIQLNGENFLSKETRSENLYRNTSLSNQHLSTYNTTEITSKYMEYVELINKQLYLTNLLPILHKKFARYVYTVSDANNQNNNNYQSNSVQFSSTSTTSSSFVINNKYKIGTQKQIYGLPLNNTSYLIIGNYANNHFIEDESLIIKRNSVIGTEINETSNNINYYYKLGIFLAVLGSICLGGELSIYKSYRIF